jgi:hypothetical protein
MSLKNFVDPYFSTLRQQKDVKEVSTAEISFFRFFEKV